MPLPADISPSERQHALNFAYMYGYPLLEYGKFISSFPGASANTVYHDRRLSTSTDFKVIRPNVDTLYSTIFLDLSTQDLVITVPEIKDRYWVFPFYDPYGNDIGNIGSLQEHKAGEYLLRLTSKDFGVFLGSPDDHVKYLGYVNLPTAYGICVARLATSVEARDQKIANVYQDLIQVTSVPRPAGLIAPPLDISIFTSSANQPSEKVSVEQAVLRLTATVAEHNQSPILTDRPWIADLLAKAGIRSGTFVMPDGSDLSKVANFAESRARSTLNSPGGRLDHGNGWFSSYPWCLGNFGSNYAARYSIAKRGYLALTVDQAVYPSLSSSLMLGGEEAILLHFSRRPALVSTGFWSLTAYNSEQFLVPNKLNRYSLGDRDKMVFADGTQLDVQSKDGEFHILLQPADLTPPARFRSNWLPAPAGGGRMSVTLRWYGAKEEMMTEAYQYPKIEYLDAIRDSHKSML